MYLHQPVVEFGPYYRVDTASGSNTPTTVTAPDGVTTVGNVYGGSGSTVKARTADNRAPFTSTTATLYLKRLSYSGAVAGDTPITSTGADLTLPSPSGGGGGTIPDGSVGLSSLNTTVQALVQTATTASSATSGTLDAGRENVLSPSSTATWTLPTGIAANTRPTTVKNNGTANVVVQRGGSDTINGGTSSVTVAVGEWARFTSNGSGAWTSSGTAGQSGAYVQKGAQVADIRDYGATGGADDSTAIQAAINSGKPQVYIPEGTWYAKALTGSVAGQRIICAGMLKLPATATDTKLIRITADNVKWQGGFIDGNTSAFVDPSPFYSNGLLQITGANITVTDLTVLNSPGAGIHAFTGCAGLLIQGCRVFATLGAGIIVNDGGATTTLRGIRITNCLVDRSMLTDPQKRTHHISVFANSGSTYRADLVHVIGNTVIGGTGGGVDFEGIDVTWHDRVVVTGNNVSGCTIGISLVRNNSVTATGNTITGAGQLGLELSGNATNDHGKLLTATGNIIDGAGVTTAQGISVQNADLVTVANNTITNLATNTGAMAVALTSISKAKISDNYLDVSSVTNGYALIAQTGVDGLRVVDNTILTGTLTTPIQIRGAVTTCEVIDNQYVGAKLIAVNFFNASAVTATGVKIYGNSLPAGSAEISSLNVTTDYAPRATSPSLTRIRAVAIGDGTTAGGLRGVDGGVVSLGSSWAAMDAVGLQQAGATSWLTWAGLLSGGRLLTFYNAGITNDTTTGMIARYTTDVLAKRPDVVFIGDARSDFLTGSGITQQTTRDNIVSMIRQAQTNGITPILITCYPENNATYAPTIRKHNAWLKQLAAGRDTSYPDISHLIVVDRYSAVVDPASSTGAWLGSYSSDGTNPNYAGAMAAGQKVVGDLAGILRGSTTGWGPWLPTDNVQGSPNRVANGLFQNDSNSDGTADSWTVSGGTTTATLVTDSAVVGKVQQVQVTAGATQIYQQLSVDGTNIQIGDRLKWAGLIKVAGSSGSLNFIVQFQFPGVSSYVVQPLNQSVGVDFGWSYVEAEAVVPASATSLRVGIGTVSGTGTISFAQQGLYNLTRGF